MPLHHILNKLRKTFRKTPVNARRVPDEMADSQRRKGLALVPVHQAVQLARTLILKYLLTHPIELGRLQGQRNISNWRGVVRFSGLNRRLSAARTLRF